MEYEVAAMFRREAAMREQRAPLDVKSGKELLEKLRARKLRGQENALEGTGKVLMRTRTANKP